MCLNRINVLILGGGNAARRYVESFIFYNDIEISLVSFSRQNKTENLAQEFGIKCFPFSKLTHKNVNFYDCLIVCVPLSGKYEIIQHLIQELKYNNSLLIEKPLTLDSIEMVHYKKLLKGRNKIGIAYLRRYANGYSTFPCKDYYKIEYSSFTDNFNYNVNHMLPHLLEWIIRESHSIVLTHSSNQVVYGKIDGKETEIKFSTFFGGQIIINGVSIKNPDYIVNNRRMCLRVLDSDTKETLSLLNISNEIQLQIENIKRTVSNV